MKSPIRVLATCLSLSALASFFVLGALAETPAPAAKPKPLSASAQRGQRVFVQYCAMCHGNGGQGDGELAPELKRRENVAVGNLTDRAAMTRLGVDGIRAAVAKGGAHTGRTEFMPRWADTLSAAQITDVSEFLVVLPDLPEGVTSSTMRGYLQSPAGKGSEGAKIYQHQCVVCHGGKGKGDGPMAAPILRLHAAKVRDLTDTKYFATRTDEQIYLVIQGGGGENGRSVYMPHWGGYLTPEQMKDLVAHVRELSGTLAKK